MSGRVRHQVLASSAVKVLQILLSVAASLLLARWLGVADFGRFSFALALAGTLAVLAMTGWPVVVSREVTRAVTLQTWSTLAGVISASNRSVMLTGSVAVLVTLAVAGTAWLGWIAQDPWTIAIAALTVPATVYAGLRCATLRGLGRVLQSQWLDAVLRPAVALLLLAWLWRQPPQTTLAMGMQVIAAGAAFVGGIWLVRRSLPVESRAAAPVIDPAWRGSLAPLTFVSGVQVLGTHAPLLLLGAMAPAEEAGLFRVASAIAAQVAFAMWPINAVFAPHVVRAHVAGDLGRLRGLIRHGRLFGLAIALPAVAGIVLVGEPALRWAIGDEFAGAWLPMVVLAVGQALSMAAGPIGPVLGMTGNERKVARATAVSLATSLGLGLALIPWWGALGAAVASAIGQAAMRTLLLRYARQVLAAGTRPRAARDETDVGGTEP